MKKVYVTPYVEFERYELDANIASSCTIVVSNGPEMEGHKQCEDYYDPFVMGASLYNDRVYNVQFYSEENCDCYYTAGEGYWTS